MFDRMRRGWQLTMKAWAVIRAHPGLSKLPLTGGGLAVLAAIVFCIPGFALLAVGNTGATVGGVILFVVGAYLAAFFVIYFNVALAAAADQALRGEEPDIAAARAVAHNRLGVIAKWALVSALISVLLNTLRERGGALGGIGAALGGAIWSLVTFLVVPVLAFEGIGPIDAIKRSAHLFRERWGQQVTGNIVIGGFSGVVVLLGVALVVVGALLAVSGSAAALAAGIVLLLIGLVLAIAGAVFGGATRGVFGVALYRYVSEQQAMGPFSVADLEGAARVR
jgi:hypothetical protein